uniref:Si:dkey-242g16.2 n=1 Tax=Neogobius melanostomus TaxID=47308 RepID=A0A8C6UX36_9GOBI
MLCLHTPPLIRSGDGGKPPVNPLTSSYTLHRPSSPSPTPASPSEPRSCFRRDHWGLKKRVSFADAKGLALTAVRLFIPDAAASSSPACHSPLPSAVIRKFQAKQEVVPAARKPPYKLRLAFTQPSLDFKVFMSRQFEVGVQLESCSVTEHCLSGRVRVSQFGLEQTVYVRISFDSWRSHYDIPCTFLHKQRFASVETDIYSFELSLPMNLDPTHGIEFSVSSRTNDGALWDDRRGKNYKIHVEKDSMEQFDAFVMCNCSKLLLFNTKGCYGFSMCVDGFYLNWFDAKLSLCFIKIGLYNRLPSSTS